MCALHLGCTARDRGTFTVGRWQRGNRFCLFPPKAEISLRAFRRREGSPVRLRAKMGTTSTVLYSVVGGQVPSSSTPEIFQIHYHTTHHSLPDNSLQQRLTLTALEYVKINPGTVSGSGLRRQRSRGSGSVGRVSCRVRGRGRGLSRNDSLKITHDWRVTPPLVSAVTRR